MFDSINEHSIFSTGHTFLRKLITVLTQTLIEILHLKELNLCL